MYAKIDSIKRTVSATMRYSGEPVVKLTKKGNYKVVFPKQEPELSQTTELTVLNPSSLSVKMGQFRVGSTVSVPQLGGTLFMITRFMFDKITLTTVRMSERIESFDIDSAEQHKPGEEIEILLVAKTMGEGSDYTKSPQFL